MEKFLKIPTSDGHLIYGTLNWHEERKDKLIIFAHGLSGNQHEHQYFNAASFFTPRGYDTFRFDFYGKEKNARQLSECSISIHAQDLNTVLLHFKREYGEIFLVGHSLGCLVIMNADVADVKKIIYWDPSKGIKSLEQKKATYDERTGLYMLHWGIEMVVNEEMVREWREASDVGTYSKRIKGDCSFVFAGTLGIEGWKPHIGKWPFAVVEGATHRFVEEGTLQELFEETLRLLEG